MFQYERNGNSIPYKTKFYHDQKNETFYVKIYPQSIYSKLIHLFNFIVKKE
jgi:hypothetical protein